MKVIIVALTLLLGACAMPPDGDHRRCYVEHTGHDYSYIEEVYCKDIGQ